MALVFGGDGPRLGGSGAFMPLNGDKSFEELALPHAESMYRFARRLTRDEHEAEDLVQETYLKAYKAFGRFQMREFGIRPWLLKILHNSFLNRRARQKKAPRSADQHDLEQHHGTDDAGLVDGSVELNLEHMDEEVTQALDDLPSDFRSVLLMWASMELSYKEIAEILDVPMGTVMSRLHRARHQMMRTLSDFAKDRRIVAKGQS
jgi:RNA polymerase sigma-70 factor (ECF subfamily)